MFKKYDAYIVGYYGMLNSGDDALMHASAWGAKNMLKNKTINMGLYSTLHDSNLTTHQQPLNFSQAFSGQNRLKNYGAALRSQSIIFGGGSVLHSESDINLKRHLMKLAGAKNSRAVGVSLGPFQSIAAEKSCTAFLNECGFTGVRDDKSLAIAKSLAPHANIKKTFDLAPLLLCAQPQICSPVERKGIALSLCSVAISPMGDVNEKSEERRVSDFCTLIESLYKNTGEPITLIEFNGHRTLGDWKINSAIMKRLAPEVPVTIKPYNPDPFAVLNDLGSYKALISMRLHGSILAYLAKTPVISINYHEKCKGWCEQSGMPSQYQFSLEELNTEAISTQIEVGIVNTFVSPSLSIDTAIQNALLNWSI